MADPKVVQIAIDGDKYAIGHSTDMAADDWRKAVITLLGAAMSVGGLTRKELVEVAEAITVEQGQGPQSGQG